MSYSNSCLCGFFSQINFQGAALQINCNLLFGLFVCIGVYGHQLLYPGRVIKFHIKIIIFSSETSE